MKRFVFVTVAALAGCVSLAPGADQVRVTKAPADVASCKAVGNVSGHPPYVSPTDAMHQLRNQAAGLGGDTLLVTSEWTSVTGVAYRCRA
jgi:hypothetical protein